MEAQEQQYRRQEDRLKAKILELWQDFSVYQEWHALVESILLGRRWAEPRRARWARLEREEQEDIETAERRAAQIANVLLDVSLETTPQEDRSCGMCREPYLGAEDAEETYSEDPVQLSCGHIFGKTCISAWLLQSSTCAICRGEVREKDEKEEIAAERAWMHFDRGNRDGSWPDDLPSWLVRKLRRDREEIWEREPMDDLDSHLRQDLDTPDQDPEINCFATFPDLSVFCNIPKL